MNLALCLSESDTNLNLSIFYSSTFSFLSKQLNTNKTKIILFFDLQAFFQSISFLCFRIKILSHPKNTLWMAIKHWSPFFILQIFYHLIIPLLSFLSCYLLKRINWIAIELQLWFDSSDCFLLVAHFYQHNLKWWRLSSHDNTSHSESLMNQFSISLLIFTSPGLELKMRCSDKA